MRITELADISALPTCVYVAYDDDDRVLYVGATVNFRTRMSEHRASSAWWPLASRIEQELHPDRQTALTREAELIKQLDPPYNKNSAEDHRERSRRIRAEGSGILPEDLQDIAKFRSIADPVARERATREAVEVILQLISECAAIRAQAVRELKVGRSWEAVGELLNPRVSRQAAFDIANPRKR
jgi:excinuclease UvrABC nuclease subunit